MIYLNMNMFRTLSKKELSKKKRMVKDRVVRYEKPNSTYYLIMEYRKELLSKSTKAEISLYETLSLLDINFVKQCPILGMDKFYICDAYLPDYNLIIEMDGEYHYTNEQLKKDRKRDNMLHRMGYCIIHFNNEEISDIEEFVISLNDRFNFNIPAYKIIK